MPIGFRSGLGGDLDLREAIHLPKVTLNATLKKGSSAPICWD